jgi:sugar phosphate isomerase/epimerase
MRIPIALQLYSVRKECEQDLPGTLRAVAEMGYDGVEFAGYYGRSAEQLRAMLEDLGLAAVGTHTPLDTLLGDRLAETAAFNRTLGNRFLIVPGLPEQYRNSRQAWLNTAATFNQIAERLAQEEGVGGKPMVTGYHNHFIEFAPMDGELPWDTFFGNTRQDVVMQLDVGNALHGGGDPIPFVQRYPGRALTVHVKEYSATNPKALIGEGDVDWDRLFELCETVGGTEWYIVEQESYAYPPLECVDRCLQALKAMGK